MTANLSAPHALLIVENSPFPVLIVDRHGCVSGYNQAFAALLGPAQAAELRGLGHADLVDHPARALLVNGKTACWTGRHGRQQHFEITRVGLDDEGATACLYADISRLIELEELRDTLNEELSRNILTDRLTGLLNQRGVMLALEPQVARSRRYNSPMAVVMMDVRGSEDDNQTRLHIARLLKDQLRWADLVGCTEQGEFILVLPETTPDAAFRLTDKLTQRVQEIAVTELGGQPLETCYGITGWQRSDNADTLLKRAAMALSRSRMEHSAQPVAL
jgi:diguanylate cyclase (GGDEF)-like protein